jgi:hypothetical protein
LTQHEEPNETEFAFGRSSAAVEERVKVISEKRKVKIDKWVWLRANFGG